MVSFGKVTEEERQHISRLQAHSEILQRQFNQILQLQANIQYLLMEFWRKVGKQHDIDVSGTPYTINKDGEIVLWEGKL